VSSHCAYKIVSVQADRSVMYDKIPYFEYQPPTRYNNERGVIKLHGEVIFSIEDMKEFYGSIGYTHEIAKQGISPDEFIWETYFKLVDANCSGCYQTHIIEYLLKHAQSFYTKYGNQCRCWLTTYAAGKEACNSVECIEQKTGAMHPWSDCRTGANGDCIQRMM